MPDRPVNLIDLSADEKKKFREKYDVFFFDMDGTLAQLTKEPIPGVSEAITTLANHGKQLHVYTDTCLHTREDLAKALRAKFPEFKKENVVTSGWLLTKHLKDIGFNKKVYVMGELNGIVKELEEAGFEVENDDVCGRVSLGDLKGVKLDPDVGAVVLGADSNFSYLKMFKAVNYLKNPDVLYLISQAPIIALYHPIIPGAGAISRAIEKVSNRTPTTCSKSSPASAEYIHSLGYDMSRCLFVGDGTQNDVACGNLCGMDTLLVLSGTSTLEHVELARERGDHHLIPTYVGGSVADLGDIFSKSLDLEFGSDQTRRWNAFKSTLVHHLVQPFPGAREVISAISASGKDMYIVTDRGEHTRERMAKNIRLLFPEFKQENILNAQWLIVHFLKSIGFNKKIYVIGNKKGIYTELEEAGFDVLCDDNVQELHFRDYLRLDFDKNVGAVVVGMDINYHYVKLVKAVNFLRNPSVLFLAGNGIMSAFKDPIMPLPGALIKPMEVILGRQARTCGKETDLMVEYLKGLGYDMKRCLFIGDRLDTDMVCGNRCGMDTLWVKTGDYSTADLETAVREGDDLKVPTYVASSVADLAAIFP